jgi:hypothetical protein
MTRALHDQDFRDLPRLLIDQDFEPARALKMNGSRKLRILWFWRAGKIFPAIAIHRKGALHDHNLGDFSSLKIDETLNFPRALQMSGASLSRIFWWRRVSKRMLDIRGRDIVRTNRWRQNRKRNQRESTARGTRFAD